MRRGTFREWKTGPGTGAENLRETYSYETVEYARLSRQGDFVVIYDSLNCTLT